MPSPRFVIRRADTRDALVRAAINAMIDEVSVELDWIYTEKCIEARGDWWIAFDGKREAAFAGLVPMPNYFATGYLCAAGVLKPYRGHGLQKRLIAKRVEVACAYGCREVYTDTIHENAASANSLIACGFKQFVPPYPWGDPKHVHFWRRPL
jgi:GNAT superfamily N-acetyltransferase